MLHVDMDAFFASVEELDEPSLVGRPVIVGGSGARGAVASCNYEARRFGVRSAMPSVRARRLCPEAVFIAGRYSRYAEVSAKLLGVLESFTPVVEPIGLDEAFLDVTGSWGRKGAPDVTGHEIRQRVGDELRLKCSVGVGRSKLIAKLASRAAKPRVGAGMMREGEGVLAVHPADELAFLRPLPVESLWGVGPATATVLHGLGLVTVGDLARVPAPVLTARLGSAQGARLAALARGIDTDPVIPGRRAKSLGHEETFAADLYDFEALKREVVRMADVVAGALRSSASRARTVTLKIKRSDMSVVSRSHTLGRGIDTAAAVRVVAVTLLRTVDLCDGVRLLGITASGLDQGGNGEQLRFDVPGIDGEVGVDTSRARGSSEHGPNEEEPVADIQWRRAVELQEDWHNVAAAVDAIRERFGRSAVGSAAMVDAGGISVPGRREAPWGPDISRK
ncbi:MAG: DNA polymerase IV [Actinomycetota bacterium]|nr:DNA polymerase IV [Actinomycetota bacterium]